MFLWGGFYQPIIHTHLSPIVHKCTPKNLLLFPNKNVLVPDETYC